MVLPNDYDKVEAKEVGEFTSLSLGAHICKILDVREYKSEQSGNTSLQVCVDIAEGEEFDGYFQKQFDADTSDKKKWPSGGKKYLSLKPEQTAYLKGFITAVQHSNPSAKIVAEAGKELDLGQFKDKKIVGVFGWEEYENDKKEVKVATKLTQFRSLDKLNEIQIPDVKLLNGKYVSVDDYEEFYRDKSNKSTGVREVSDQELHDLLDGTGIDL